jgi:hypothetical protein
MMWRTGTTRGRTPYVRLWLIAGLTCMLACGGKADEGEGSNEAGGGLGSSPNATAAGGTSKPGSTQLGACHMGFSPADEPTRPCAWVGRGLCYDTKPEACACICPLNRQDSVCSSDFPDGPNGKVEVKCY